MEIRNVFTPVKRLYLYHLSGVTVSHQLPVRYTRSLPTIPYTDDSISPFGTILNSVTVFVVPVDVCTIFRIVCSQVDGDAHIQYAVNHPIFTGGGTGFSSEHLASLQKMFPDGN